MSAKFTVVEALPPSKLRGVSGVTSGFSYKLRYIRDDDDFWLKKGWEYLLPATNLPARWSKMVGSEVVWAMFAGESSDCYSRYNFWRRKDHWFNRHTLASHQKALQSRSLFTLVQGNAMRQPDENELYEAVMGYGWFNRGLEEPEIEVGFSLDSFEGQWKKDNAGFEITTAEYVCNGSRAPLNVKTEQGKNVLRVIFGSHDLSSFLEDNEMTQGEFWSSVNENYRFLRD